MKKTVTWKLSDRLISYFASSIYGGKFDTIAVREALQNSVDCKAKKFRVHIIDNRNVVIENNGKPLTLEEIENQLFTLGESTKENGTQVGFFGVGECAIIAPCEKWKIETGKYKIENFTVTENSEYLKGTRHTLTFREDVRAYKIRHMLEYHNTKMKVTVQEGTYTKIFKARNFKKCRHYDIPNGAFIWKKTGEPHTVIRVNGVPQYVDNRYDEYGTWIIDLNTSTVLTVSREQIRDEKTKETVDSIKNQIRRISEHISGDRASKWVTEPAPFLFARKRGIVNRRNVYSKPVRKIHDCTKVLNDYFSEKYQKTLPFGLMCSNKDNPASVRDGTIFININDRNINPPMTFILTLCDDYTHELAHVVGDSWSFNQTHTALRKEVYRNTKLLTAMHKILREENNNVPVNSE